MKILFFSDHFYPEPSAPAAHVYERAALWVKAGHSVTVVTVGGGDEVLGERAGSFTLKPDQTRTFTWPRFYQGPAEACLPRVLRRPL